MTWLCCLGQYYLCCVMRCETELSAGTYLALASLTQQVEAGCEAVDVLGTVLQLRARRPKMVQTQEQYTFLYQVQYSAIQYSAM